MRGNKFLCVLYSWVIAVVLLLGSLQLPHEEVSTWSILNNSIQLLLFVLCIFIARNEPTRRSKFVFANFALFFGFSILFHIYNFVPGDLEYVRFFYFQYVGIAGYYFVLTLAIAYVVVDVVFRNLPVLQKYVWSLTLVSALFVFYFHPFLVDPFHVYSIPDAQDYSQLETSYDKFVSEFGVAPTAEELASKVVLPSRGEGSTGEAVNTVEAQNRVAELYPYLLSENNYVVLFARPLYLNIIFMCVVCVGLIVVFFGYQYTKDPPQGAYLDKIMGLFLLFCTMEILHAWSYAQSVEWSSLYELMNIGQGITLVVLALIGLFFTLRLKFITSPNGEYYEQEIASRPAGITRWRDDLDNLIMAGFFKKGGLAGRFFVERNQT